jgi:alkyl sulfatase BDS1-like metallo-beta-lactamase superfamily hydrolase
MRFLSPEWLNERLRQAGALTLVPGADITIQHVVPDAPDGPIRYYDVIKDGLLTNSGLGTIPSPDVTITAGWQEQIGLMRGQVDVIGSVMSGRFKIDGDQMKLFVLVRLAQSQPLAFTVIARNLVDLIDAEAVDAGA